MTDVNGGSGCPQIERGSTPDEVGTVGALLIGPDGAFIPGSDFLMDKWRVSSTNGHVRPCNLKPQQRDLTPLLHRPVEPAALSGHPAAVAALLQLGDKRT